MRQPTVYTSPGERPKFNFLLTENYLSEFRSEIDKARVRQNLGIPDNYNLYWGNIKGNIRNQLDLISLLDKDLGLSQINANIHNLQAYVLNHEAYIKALGDVTEISNLVTDIRQNATDISNLTLKVNQLMNGSNTGSGEGTPSYPTTDYSQDISKLKTDVQTILNQLATVSGRLDIVSERITNVSGRFDTLENKVNGLENKVTGVESKLNTLESKVNTLESKINGPVLSRIYASQTNISITTEGSSNIVIYAEYSNSNTPVEITNSCIVSFSNNSIAEYSNGIITPLTEGNTKITFTYNGKTCEVELTVTNSQSETPNYPQYIGWASNASQIFENNSFKVDTISGTWNDNNLSKFNSSVSEFGFFIITTQSIEGVYQGPFKLDLEVKQQLTHSKNNQVYNVYMPAAVKDTSNVEFKIQIN